MSRETYSAIREPGPTGYRITFPLFPECEAFGRTQREAQANATQALELHIAGMSEDGKEIPFEEPDDENDVLLHSSGGTGGDAFPIWVTVEIGDKGGERVNVYLQKRLVAQVDRFAMTHGMNRSSIFQVAVRRYMQAELSRNLHDRNRQIG
jgi:predicted RNase H-like HicB family nuclease